MNNLVDKTIQTIPSYEVAKMMERPHWKVLNMIEGKAGEIGITKVLTDNDFVVSDYFIESNYKDASGKSNKCYECTKLGCDLLANKLTGEKGILFTARYVNKFNKMEQVINLNPYQELSKELQAIFALDKNQQAINRKIDTVAGDLKDFKENAPLFNVECEELQKALKKKVVNLLGGKQSIAYRDNSVRQKAFIDIQHQIKREFAVNSYKGIKRIHFAKALEIIEDYRLPTALQEVVEVLNCQVSIQNVAKSDFYS